MERILLTLSVVLAPWLSRAQTVELNGGSMSIAPGTTMRLNGSLTFVLQPGTSVTNNGLIDLGDAATLQEPLGEPIQGDGTEVVRVLTSGDLDGSEPGGLGLGLTGTAVNGPLTITRGHTPRAFPEGDPSIARWYMLDAPNVSAGAVEAVLRYDPVELNGLLGNNLGLFTSSDPDGPWSPLSGSNNAAANTVSATLPAPWSYLTAFDANAPTASPTLFATEDLHVWPTLTNGPLVVHALNGRTLITIEVMDATGRVVHAVGSDPSSSLVTMDLSALASGPYYLRVNGQSTIKLRKE
ncbi:MAG: hypothetical protein ACO1NQ_09675 [Flavobacteriales bacterium]